MRKYFPDLAIAISTLCLGGFMHFVVEWGQVTKAVASMEIEQEGFASKGDTELVQKRLDSMEQRMGDLLKLQNDTLRLLGRLEGRNDERDKTNPSGDRGAHRP